MSRRHHIVSRHLGHPRVWRVSAHGVAAAAAASGEPALLLRFEASRLEASRLDARTYDPRTRPRRGR
jgi:hypothetical protein